MISTVSEQAEDRWRMLRCACWVGIPILLFFKGLALIPVLLLTLLRLRARDAVPWPPWVGRIVGPFAAFFAWLCLVTALHGGDLSDIDTPSRWLLLPLMIWLAAGDRDALRMFAIGSVAVLVWQTWHVFNFSDGVRAQGASGPVVTSQAVTMAFMVVVAAAMHQTRRWAVGIVMLASIMLSIIVALTAARGVLLGVGLTLLLFTGLFRWWRTALLIGALAMAVMLAPTYIGKRLAVEAVQDVTSLQAGDYSSSIGIRAGFLIVAWEGLRSSPWIGHGVGTYQIALSKAIDERRLPEFGRGFGEPHNDLVTAFYAYGVVGGLLFLASLVIPSVACYRQIRQGNRIAYAPLALIVFTGVSCLSASIFLAQLPSAMFFICLGILTAAVHDAAMLKWGSPSPSGASAHDPDRSLPAAGTR